MGGEQFEQYQEGTDLQEAFNAAREQAAYDHGHAGYTGTIAEKSDVELRSDKVFTMKEAKDFAEEDSTNNEKWGPAFAVRTEAGFLFYGWASS